MTGMRLMGRRKVGSRPEIETGHPIYKVLGNGGTVSRYVPGYSERRQQIQLSVAAYEAILSETHLLGQAGTGVGKSYAYTAAAVEAAVKAGKRVVIAVPTIALQTQLIEKDLPRMAQPGILSVPFTFALLKGRRNYVCRLKADQWLTDPTFTNREDAAILPSFTDWYRTTTDGDLGKLSMPLPMAVQQEVTADSDECLGEGCPSYQTCYGENAKARAGTANVVVTNNALLMLDLRLRSDTDGMATILPDDVEVLILDECHRLRESAANAFTTDVTLSRFERIRQRVVNIARKAQRAAERTQMEDMAVEAAAAEEEGRAVRDITPTILDDWTAELAAPAADLRATFGNYAAMLEESGESAIRLGDESESIMDAVRSVATAYAAMVEKCPTQVTGTDRALWDKMAAALLDFEDDLLSVGMPQRSQNRVRFATLEGEGQDAKVTLSYAPIDVAPFLRDTLWNASLVKPKRDTVTGEWVREHRPLTVIAVSATVVESGSFDYFRESVGMDHAREILVDSPFDYVRDTRLYIPAEGDFNPTTARKDAKLWMQYLDNIADECVRLVNASRGRAFLLFTSRKVMNETYDRMTQRNRYPGRLPWPILKQGDAGQTQLIEAFKTQPSILLGLKSYWEGVDVPGDALSLVVIAAMPFTPPSDPQFAARCEMVERRHGRGSSFRKVSIPEATTALQQAFGRGKRTETDRVVVAILDRRLTEKQYGPGVISSLPSAPLTHDFADVRRFFE